ncbi:MAG TPA: flagellar basal body P-ring formation chaperone FlgA [Bryobacteraceae bacterium]
MLKSLLFLLAVGTSLQAACVAVEGDQIAGRDLARIYPVFSAVSPDLYFSYAPPVGKQRIVSATELTGWASSNGLTFKSQAPVCFERTAYVLTAADAAATIQRTFGQMFPGIKVDVVDVCKCNLPPGTLEFPLAGAALPPLGHPETPVMWRGQLTSRSGMRYPIWVRARVLAQITLVRAKENIRAQQVIEANQVEAVSVTESPLRFAGMQTAATYIGKLAGRSVPEGTYLDLRSVRMPSDVMRGEVVKVDVIDGATHLQLQARAETAGNIGDKVTLVNPSGFRRFQATISGPGRARITLSSFADGKQTTAENKGALVATTSEGIL